MCLNYTKDAEKNQILSDKDKDGEERPWREKKMKSLELAESYERIGLSGKSERVKACGCHLVFKVNSETGKKKLESMISCQVRLCSMCNWRRSLKIFGQVSKVMDKALEYKEYRFIFLTLTCKNVYSGKLSTTIDSLFKGFKHLIERKQFEKAIKGWFRALEITHDIDEFITYDMWFGNEEKHIKSRAKYYKSLGLKIGDRNPNFDQYHPHFHIILMVNKSYFKEKTQYISQEDWTNLWKESLDVSYTPVVNVKAFKTGNKFQTSKSVAEIAKYTVKDNDYLVRNKELTDKTVLTLDGALTNRRLVAFGGELRKIHKLLNLDDPEKASVNTDNANEEIEIREDVKYHMEVYKWNVGYNQYVLSGGVDCGNA